MNVSLVTVIIPTIGRISYLKGAIDSVLNQSYKNIEIIISDNKSNISVRDALSSYLDSRLRFVRREVRLDFISHINLCIREAEGTYLMILSDDDLISENFIESMVNEFDADPSVGIGLSPQIILSTSDCELKKINSNQRRLIDGWDFIEKYFLGGLEIPIYTFVSFFSRADLIREFGGFSEFISGSDGSHSDNYLLIKIAQKTNVVITESTFGYRVYPESTGLQTPITKLYQAGVIFEKNINKILLLRFGFFSKKYLKLIFTIRRSLVFLCIDRLRRYYFGKITFKSYVMYFLYIFFRHPILLTEFFLRRLTKFMLNKSMRLYSYLVRSASLGERK